MCVAGWKADMFNWEEYLSYCNAEAAPADVFATVSSVFFFCLTH